MEFLYSNYLDTTTRLVVNNNTGVAANVLNRDYYRQWVSSGLNVDLTIASARINFDETQTVSRIALVEHNLKDFRLYYNGVTLNTFALTTTGDTTVSNWATNSNTAGFFRCTPQACTSVSIDMRSTIVANAEKALGWFYVGDIRYVLDHFPNSQGWRPHFAPKQVVHRLSDGGVRVNTFANKYETSIQLQHVSIGVQTNLRTIYNLHSPIVFAPFGTTTSWDAIIFQCAWVGAFDFYKYSDDAATAGFSGRINLAEVTE